MVDTELPSAKEIAILFSSWPDEFKRQFARLGYYIPMFPNEALEYLQVLVPLLNIQWEVFYNSGSLAQNPSLDCFYSTLFAVFRHCGARFDCAVQNRPWQYCEPSIGAFQSRSRAVSLLYHLEKSPSRQNWIYKEASLPGYIHFDAKGYAGWSQIALDGIDARFDLISEINSSKFYDSLFADYVAGRRSKYAQSNEAPPQGKYYFFPLQLVDDAVQKLAKIKMLDAARASVQYLANENCSVVFKRHPLCTSSAVEQFLKEACGHSNVLLSKSSIHDLISGCESVITVNSGVGFEALLHLKSVFVAGRCDYEAACHKLNTIEDIRQIPNILETRAPPLEIKRFLYYILNTQQCRAKDERHVAAHLIRTMFIHRPI